MIFDWIILIANIIVAVFAFIKGQTIHGLVCLSLALLFFSRMYCKWLEKPAIVMTVILLIIELAYFAGLIVK